MAEQVLSNHILGDATVNVSSTNTAGIAPMAKLAVEMIRPPIDLDFDLYLYGKDDKVPRLYRNYNTTTCDFLEIWNPVGSKAGASA